MPFEPPVFTVAELVTIRCGLESAVITYRECALKITGNARISRQFTEQADDAQKLVDRLNEAGY